MNRQGHAIILLIAALFLTVGALVPTFYRSDSFTLTIRLFALYGYLMLTIATLTTPFLREISQAFGKSFLTIHHSFAAAGIILITLHPVSYAIQTLDMAVFIPNFSSWIDFWWWAGRPALILVYTAVAFAFVRRRTIAFWRGFHALAYVALFFGIVHGNLLGNDFKNPAIVILYDALFAAVILSFALKRLRNYQIKKKIAKRRNANHPNA